MIERLIIYHLKNAHKLSISLKRSALLMGSKSFNVSRNLVKCLSFFLLHLHVMNQENEKSEKDRDAAENQTLITKNN